HAEEVRPTFWTAYKGQGLVLHRYKRLEEEEQTYRRAIAHGASPGEAYYALGSLYKETRRLDEAVKALAEAVRRDPRNVKAPARPAAAEKPAVYRSFWRKLEAPLSAIEAQPDLAGTLDTILQTLLRDFRAETRFVAGRLYEKVDETRYALRRWHGDHPPDKLG